MEINTSYSLILRIDALVVDELLAKLSGCQMYANDIMIFVRGFFEEVLYDL